MELKYLLLVLIVSAIASYYLLKSIYKDVEKRKNKTDDEKYIALDKKRAFLKLLVENNPDNTEWEEELINSIKELEKLDISFGRFTGGGGNYIPNTGIDTAIMKASLTNNVFGIMNGRPDLAFMTSQHFKGVMEYLNYYNGLDDRQRESFILAQHRIPELIQIAEMYFDYMASNDQKETLPFKVVKETLNNIANGKV